MINKKGANKILMIVMMLFLGTLTPLYAQGDHYDQGGKLYAVVACVAIILIGIVAFLFYLERRISKMETKEEV